MLIIMLVFVNYAHFSTIYSEIMLLFFTLRPCFHGGGGPQVGEVTCLGGLTLQSIQSLIWSPHLSCKRDQIEIRDYMKRGGYPTYAGYLTYLGSPTSM